MPFKDPAARRENHRRYMRDVWYPQNSQTPEVRARLIVRNEVKTGRLAPVELIACSKCASTVNVQRHHPDHEKPLEFVELCVDCHRDADISDV